MKSILKGSYKLNRKKRMRKVKSTAKDPFKKFESEAIKRLGGSIAFVSKSQLLWTGAEDEKVK